MAAGGEGAGREERGRGFCSFSGQQPGTLFFWGQQSHYVPYVTQEEKPGGPCLVSHTTSFLLTPDSRGSQWAAIEVQSHEPSTHPVLDFTSLQEEGRGKLEALWDWIF